MKTKWIVIGIGMAAAALSGCCIGIPGASLDLDLGERHHYAAPCARPEPSVVFVEPYRHGHSWRGRR